jgi:hypothetical protein
MRGNPYECQAYQAYQFYVRRLIGDVDFILQLSVLRLERGSYD